MEKTDKKWNMNNLKTHSSIDEIPKGIIHFTGPDKPWHHDFLSPIKETYFDYLNMTYWKGFKLKKPSRVDRFLLSVLNIARKFVLACRFKWFSGYTVLNKIDKISMRRYLMLKSQFYMHGKTEKIYYSPYAYMESNKP